MKCRIEGCDEEGNPHNWDMCRKHYIQALDEWECQTEENEQRNKDQEAEDYEEREECHDGK